MMSPRAAVDVILVDADDRAVGVCEKLAAHQRGLRHRAVSVFAFDDHGRLLLQQRTAAKYHSGGLWSNTACTHPRVGESIDEAARRCLVEEVGLEPSELRFAFTTEYRLPVGDGLVEHEVDHVFVARVSGVPTPDPGEVSETRYVGLEAAVGDAAEHPARYTGWFAVLAPLLVAWRGMDRDDGEMR